MQSLRIWTDWSTTMEKRTKCVRNHPTRSKEKSKKKLKKKIKRAKIPNQRNKLEIRHEIIKGTRATPI